MNHYMWFMIIYTETTYHIWELFKRFTFQNIQIEQCDENIKARKYLFKVQKTIQLSTIMDILRLTESAQIIKKVF